MMFCTQFLARIISKVTESKKTNAILKAIIIYRINEIVSMNTLINYLKSKP